MWTQICWHTLHTFGCLNWIGGAGNCCVDSTGKMWVSYDRWVWNGAWRFQYTGDSCFVHFRLWGPDNWKVFLAYLVQNCKHLRRSWFVECNSLAEVYCCYYFSFWATVSKIVHPILSDHCLSCLWRWYIVAKRLMDQDETWHGGRPWPQPHCVRWEPKPPKGHSSPQFSFHVYCSQTAECIRIPLGTEVRLKAGLASFCHWRFVSATFLPKHNKCSLFCKTDTNRTPFAKYSAKYSARINVGIS